MQIPQSAINIAGAAALPQQTADARKGEQAGGTPSVNSNSAVERIGQSEQSGDRDANEQYSDQNVAPAGAEEPQNEETPTKPSNNLLDLEAIDPSESTLDLEG